MRGAGTSDKRTTGDSEFAHNASRASTTLGIPDTFPVERSPRQPQPARRPVSPLSQATGLTRGDIHPLPSRDRIATVRLHHGNQVVRSPEVGLHCLVGRLMGIHPFKLVEWKGLVPTFPSRGTESPADDVSRPQGRLSRMQSWSCWTSSNCRRKSMLRRVRPSYRWHDVRRWSGPCHWRLASLLHGTVDGAWSVAKPVVATCGTVAATSAI